MADTTNNITSPSPNLLWQTRLKLNLLTLTRRIYGRPDGSNNRRLLSFFDMKSPASATKYINDTTVSMSDVTVDESRELWFRLYVPRTRSESPLPLIVYFHGGGFTTYGPDSVVFDHFCAHLSAGTPAVVASVNYRLAPEYRCPLQYEDGFDALKFIDLQNYAILPSNTDLNKCFVTGDSAGANIAHHVTVRACKNKREFEKLRITGMIALEPFFGGEERTESEMRLANAPMINVERTDRMWSCFLPEGADRNHPAARVFGSEKSTEEVKSMSEFPKVLVVIGGLDPLQDWDRMYVEWLRKCGKDVEVIEYANAFHGFYGFSEVAEFDLLVQDVAKFIKKQG